MIKVTLLGSTGSIGSSTLDVIRRHPERFRLFALAANSSVDSLHEQVLEFRPDYAVMVDPAAAQALRARLAGSDLGTQVLDGEAALDAVATDPEVDAVMAAIVGAAGLGSAYAAAEAGKRVMLANKESLVVAGQLFMDAVSASGATLLPVDSEHNAVFQCLPAGDRQGVRRILLTASGGPFRRHRLDELTDITPEQAIAHPNWSMGPKISVDSATMMNKGLEVIEAHWLFDAEPDDIQVVVHPQSIIHSMVEYIDGSVLAQMGNPDMRTPIAYALDWPNRIASGAESLDLFAIGRLDFEAPDFERFPCLALAYHAIRAGGTAPAILNAANEVAVQAFHDRVIPYLAIPELIRRTLDRIALETPESIAHLLEVDARARRASEQITADLV
ncbi:MAG: 1-deoxy-D-xylulose-5-phosphate reductoisomerase [Gammaproteobacteria bacterium]